MTVIFGIVGLAIGMMLGGWRNAIFGAVIGLLAGEIFALKSRLGVLEQALQLWQEYFRKIENGASKVRATTDPTTSSPLRDAQLTKPTTVMPKTVAAEYQPIKKEGAAYSQPQPQSSRTSEPLPSRVQVTPSYARDAEQPSSDSEQVELPLVRWIRDFFTGGNTMVRVGVVVLFFGVAFLLQYTAEHVRVPIQMRLLGVVLAAIVFLGLGWRLRQRRGGFALALQGGAIGVLYLVIFAAWRLYHLLNPTFAFALLLAIVLLSGVLAILQNSIWLAVLGISGGFLAPILTSTGHGSHVALFSFYAVLNIGILLIAWFKSWRVLNLLGFVFTFVIGTTWGVLSYRSEFFASTEPFLILFFLFYVAIALLYALKQSVQIGHHVDGALIFGVPIVAFGLQAALLRDQQFQLSGSAIAVAAFYLILAKVLWQRTGLRLLVESFLALAIAFATLAVPLALDGHWSAATWAVEGAALIWVGTRQSRLLPRLSGAALQSFSALLFVFDGRYQFGAMPVLNSSCLGAALIGVAGIASSAVLYRYANLIKAWERPFASIAFWWGLMWCFVAGNNEIQRLLPHEWRAHVLIVYFVVLASVSSVLCTQRQIRAGAVAAWLLLPVLVLSAGFDWQEHLSPTAYGGWIAWPLAFAAWYWILRRHETAEQFSALALRIGHVIAAGLLLLVLSRELMSSIEWLMVEPVSDIPRPFVASSWTHNAWVMCGAVLLPAMYLVLWRWLRGQLRWPIAAHAQNYLTLVGGGIVVWLLLWSVFVSIRHDGTALPLPYVPLLNPIDLMQMFAFMAMVVWWRRASSTLAVVSSEESFLSQSRSFYGLLGMAAFLWLNAVLMRTLHHWQGIPYDAYLLWHSVLVQTSLSIFWTIIALTTMWLATRKGWRVLWFAGAVLMGAELVKLFFVDLSNSGSVARIISFLGVGLLVVLIGYVAPLPPQMNEGDAQENEEAAQ